MVFYVGLRVLGIGRNEYLALISELKTNSTKLFRKPNPLNFLPKFPVRINIEPWWKVEIGYVLESDVKVSRILSIALKTKKKNKFHSVNPLKPFICITLISMDYVLFFV